MRQVTTYFQVRKSDKIQTAKMWALLVYAFLVFRQRNISLEIVLLLIDLCLYLYDIAFYTKDEMV